MEVMRSPQGYMYEHHGHRLDKPKKIQRVSKTLPDAFQGLKVLYYLFYNEIESYLLSPSLLSSVKFIKNFLEIKFMFGTAYGSADTFLLKSVSYNNCIMYLIAIRVVNNKEASIKNMNNLDTLSSIAGLW